ncbi:hypothetical protein BDC45DRAFT_565665 [Circinella umbellata]|nr:hypothetical protein BDC45DRAFT_565665 [Circinella umbellata]
MLFCEVADLTPEEIENPLGGYGKMISHVIIGLKKERVTIGDVIYIEANTGAVKRVERLDAFATEFDVEAEEYVPFCTEDVVSPHGIPIDLFGRLLIIRTLPYAVD